MSGRIVDIDNGVMTKIHDLGDRVVIEKIEDISAVVEANKRQYNAVSKLDRMGDGLHHVGRVPIVVMERWMREDGINYLAAENKGLLLKKLENPDNRVFKVDPRKFA